MSVCLHTCLYPCNTCAISVRSSALRISWKTNGSYMELCLSASIPTHHISHGHTPEPAFQGKKRIKPPLKGQKQTLERVSAVQEVYLHANSQLLHTLAQKHLLLLLDSTGPIDPPINKIIGHCNEQTGDKEQLHDS